MTVTVVSGTQNRDHTFRSEKSYTGSTSTSFQTLDPSYDVLNIGLSTAATVGLNQYLLATDSAMEGRVVYLQATATGTASVLMAGTATGFLVFTAATDAIVLRHLNAFWYIDQNNGATFGTATA